MDLKGKRVVVTRSLEQAGEMVDLICKRGAHPLIFPTIKIIPPNDLGPVRRAIKALNKYEWVIFTSANGVKYFLFQMEEVGVSFTTLAERGICAIGPATASALRRKGLEPDLIPPRFVAEEVLNALKGKDIKGKAILLPRAQGARDVLPNGLRKAGVLVDVVTVYRTVKAQVSEEAVSQLGMAHIFTFTSPSTVKNFFAILGKGRARGLLERSLVASIGPVTTSALQELGIKNVVEAREYTIPGLVSALEEL